MKHVFIIFSIFCLFPFQGNCQVNLPPVYQITSDSVAADTIPALYWKMLEDKKGNYTIQDVSNSPIGEGFHYSSKNPPTFEYSIHTYWLCFRVKNIMDHNAEAGFLSSSFGLMEQSSFLFKLNGSWVRKENGFFYPWKKLNGLLLNKYMAIQLKPGEEMTIYNRVSNTYFLPFNHHRFFVILNFTRPTIITNYIADETLYGRAVHNSILFGILIFVCLFNLFFFLISRELVYLYFSLYILILAIGRMPEEFYFVFFRSHRVASSIILMIDWNTAIFMMAQFLRSFLKVGTNLPKWDRFLGLLNYSCLVIHFLNIPLILLAPQLFQRIDTDWLIVSIVFDFLLMLALLASFMLILAPEKERSRTTALLIFPAFFVWSFGQTIAHSFDAFGFITISQPLTLWVRKWWFFIETFTLGWLVLVYSMELLFRFKQLQTEIVNQSLNQEKERALLMEAKKAELERTVLEKTADLQQSLERLQSTQHQLVQSEKMASLGEMTAGIAHEIQNPLNFVNNFSDINKELICELGYELQQEHLSEVRSLLKNIVQNEEKIAFHGKRADAIVKSMLMHSRSTKGTKEPTDINALVDEYLRLSYHGFRAKDKSFNVKTESHLDPDLPLANIVAQDMGRVILNLLTNAFYSVISKARLGVNGYQPTVSVCTKTEGKMVEIRIKDNGLGISPQILDKIFNPFFTTKPGGEGTGLGLSLSYEIITKEHSGEITVDSIEGEFAEFIIRLPIITHEPIVDPKPHKP